VIAQLKSILGKIKSLFKKEVKRGRGRPKKSETSKNRTYRRK